MTASVLCLLSLSHDNVLIIIPPPRNLQVTPINQLNEVWTKFEDLVCPGSVYWSTVGVVNDLDNWHWTGVKMSRWRSCLKSGVMGQTTGQSYGPRQANLVLIAYTSSQGSGEPGICAVSPEPPLLAHTSSESRGTFRQKARSLVPMNGWAFAVKICHDGILEDTNLLDAPHIEVKVGLRNTLLISVKVQVHDQIFFAKDCMPCNRLCRNCSCYWSIFRRCLSLNNSLLL